MNPLVSIIVRTKNEERWIAHCLDMIFSQSYKEFEIILVDNASNDHTVNVAKRFPLKKIINIDDFKPGLAINLGIRASSGKYIVCLSAHCVPVDKDWLANLVRNLNSDEIAAAYGRQIPVSFTDDVDKRDLLITFGQDRRVQIKDYFFHNANSIFRRDVWDNCPFDEKVTNIEDRVWAKEILAKGYKIIYDPEASVYHHHGLHQGNKKDRAKGVVSIIENLDHEFVSKIPDSLRPENANIVAVIPFIKKESSNDLELTLLQRLVATLKNVEYVNKIYCVTNDAEISKYLKVEHIQRDLNSLTREISLDKVLQFSLEHIESNGNFPEAVLYANYDYPFHTKELFESLIWDAQYKGYDTVFPGFQDYSHIWLLNPDGDFVQLDGAMTSRDKREPTFRALYGMGCLTGSSFIRKGVLVGGRIGILPVSDLKQTLRARELGSEEVINLLVKFNPST